MLTRDQSKRITAAGALDHPWIKVCVYLTNNPHFSLFKPNQ